MGLSLMDKDRLDLMMRALDILSFWLLFIGLFYRNKSISLCYIKTNFHILYKVVMFEKIVERILNPILSEYV